MARKTNHQIKVEIYDELLAVFNHAIQEAYNQDDEFPRVTKVAFEEFRSQAMGIKRSLELQSNPSADALNTWLDQARTLVNRCVDYRNNRI